MRNMKKSETKMILNVSVVDEELEAKIEYAMDKYVQNIVIGKLDDTIIKIVKRRVNQLINSCSWSNESKIKGKNLKDMSLAEMDAIWDEAKQKGL
jgi:uncharacterized protein YabN with tetrapyrrole methylase and pyrophosphatase domain